ncbi:TPA: tyrosine-type recombinase/integrase [Legionella pneumophila]|nr:tyrosine-type recombinase/integrase [Legionella pneumophila]HAT9433640.1 tyrosine-type recombinase/integrase [Legionella pneumophila subsp. pneumophila]HAT4482107.1 tyrosine-type recombinase/integrase [Legionella pneumophila]HAU1866380.1 tyrosine-type recombinase/integrase [Legionella pneumophila]HBD7463163.1 tyrosine-type recombinase/integrase [Legionella pneumophila]
MKHEDLLNAFKAMLEQQDLSESSITSYLQGINVFTNWALDFYQQEVGLLEITTNDLRAYREYVSKIQRRKPATINHHIQVLKRFYAWAEKTKLIPDNPASALHFVKRATITKPNALNKDEIHALLRAAGLSTHGLATRNYAIVQLLLQSGLRVGELNNLLVKDIIIRERSGCVNVVDGKGRKHREIPLNSIARRAIASYLETREPLEPDNILFTTKRGEQGTIRALQSLISSLAKRANITRIHVTAHTLRHTFATQFLQANPGCLVELAMLMGHESVNTTAIYTKASKEKLAEHMERSGVSIDAY